MELDDNSREKTVNWKTHHREHHITLGRGGHETCQMQKRVPCGGSVKTQGGNKLRGVGGDIGVRTTYGEKGGK